MLYVVPTPIGNLKDITLHAIEVLNNADLILAEDTRTTAHLLKHYEITTSCRSFHIHNEHKVLEQYTEMAREKMVALVSDAGTPGISDPGFSLVRSCLAQDIEVNCLPGATAFVPSLVNSGLSLDKFFFEGFLPTKKGRKTRLEFLSGLAYTFVLYESPHRIKRCISELIEYCGADRKACLSRELTKMHEENIRGDLASILEHISKKTKVKGEIVVSVAGTKNC